MRVILHIGMAKAGSTALQAALVAARRKLRRAGILYPKGAFNQNFLVVGVAPDQVGRLFEQRYADDMAAMHRDFGLYWDRIVDVVGRRRPSVVVLSAELLFGVLGRSGPEPLRRLVAPLGGHVEIACYVRRPSDYYLSMAQQRLKASSRLPPAGAVGYRRSLQAAMAAADIVRVVPYERSRFPGGDIVADFVMRFLPEAAGHIAAVDDPKVRASLSAEAMAVVQSFRSARHPGEDDRFTRDTGLLIRRLSEREAELGGQRRPQLLAEVRDRIDRSSVDLLWLRDTFGIVFNGIDYGAIAPGNGFHPGSVADICLLDPERHAVLAQVEAAFDVPADGQERDRFRAVPRRPRS